MAALHTVALAFTPKFAHFLARRKDGHPVAQPTLRIVAAASGHAPRHRVLSCHWERADDGSLVAHWVRDTDDQSHARACGLLREIPSALIDDAYRFEHHGSVRALIAMSRLARMNHSKRARRFRNVSQG